MTDTKLMVKAIHRSSREVRLIFLSPAADPMNHCICVIHLFVLITLSCMTCRMRLRFSLSSIRQYVPFISLCPRLISFRHIVFMHRDRVVHFLTNYPGHCACMDYKLSWRVDLLAPGTYWLKEPRFFPSSKMVNLYTVEA